jgi:hypothetical protein
MEVSLHPYD